jgi:hypothetical protein
VSKPLPLWNSLLDVHKNYCPRELFFGDPLRRRSADIARAHYCDFVDHSRFVA